MRRLEQILVLLALVGILLGYFNIPFGGIATLIGLLFLSLFYFPLSIFYFNNVNLKGLVNQRSEIQGFWWRVGAGYFISSSIIGVLFAMKDWPMSSSLLLFGAIGMLFFMLTKIIFGKHKIRILDIIVLSRLGIYFAICVGFYLFY